MNDTNAGSNPTTPATTAVPSPVPGPTSAQRQTLVRNYQSQALQRTDALAANVRMLTADLLTVSHALAARLERTPDAAASRGFSQEVELLLKVARQIDRLAQIEQRAVAAAEG